MAKIKQLSPAEAQKIAAGEVVERPANVIKELIENALDAQATVITLYIEDTGKKLIRVIDNGCGMSYEDARMCIKHHATSKITQVTDLQTITTFGFRGEALSSIAAVSHVILKTKEADNATGIRLVIQEGSIQKETPEAGNTGTDIEISDLFYNVPARRKFLKAKETEWRVIVQLFQAFCLDYLQVHFALYHDDKLVYNCPRADTLQKRLAQLYDHTLIDYMLPVNPHTRDHITLTGAISNSQYNRYDRNYIFLFVNKRWIKNYKLVQAFIKGYQQMLPTQRYPAGFLFLTIDPEQVDINIHPRKEEVQFLHPRIVESLLEQAVKLTLEAYYARNLGETQPMPLSPPPANIAPPLFPEITPSYALSTGISSYTPKPVMPKEQFVTTVQHNFTQPAQEYPAQAHQESLSYKLIGQVLNTYILIENQEGLVYIDQHAAHERIIYERIASHFGQPVSLKLIFPHTLSLPADDLAVLMPHSSLLAHCGFVCEQKGSNQLVIYEVPLVYKDQKTDDLIKYVISLLYEHSTIDPTLLHTLIKEKVHALISCKAAVKAGDILPDKSMHELIKDLYKLDNKLTCPHGRPTLWIVSIRDIEKKFKRDYT